MIIALVLLNIGKPNPMDRKQHFTWVSRYPVTKENAHEMMRVARARWKVENETFNTLKNQGYNFEHNFGHGKKHLCSVFSMLMMLAFLIDQVQQAVCEYYQMARKSCGALKYFHHEIRVVIRYMVWENWCHLFKTMASPSHHPPPTTTVRCLVAAVYYVLPL